MIANIQSAIWNREVVTIGGGQFSGEELRLLLRQAKIGQAIELICKELPFGCEVIASLERGAGSVTLIDADGNEHDIEADGPFDQALLEAVKTAKALP